MFDKFKRFYSNATTQFSLYSVTITIISIAILNWSQILAPLELNIYDFNFGLRPLEKTEDRIVIVKWDDENISALKETTVSDRTLSRLLEKIIEQKPREIGLDLYRDIPVSSPTLADEENLIYYQTLKELFAKSNNVFGIEKVIEPIVDSPPILEQKGQVAASDLPVDIDKAIRRSYIYPETTSDGTAAGLPYLGARLAYEYLADENFSAENFGENALKLYNKQTKIILNPLESFVGSFTGDKYSFNILVNWRKANPAFKIISVIDVLSNRTPANFFTDKIVLIGGMATSIADRHQTPLNHWNDSIVYGIEILAQATSSIISAALDGRQLINPANQLIKLLLVAFSAAAFILAIYKNQHARSIHLYFWSFGYAICLSLLLLLCAVISMHLGYWLPVTTAIGSIWILYFALNYYVYKLNDKQRVALFEAFITDRDHSTGNIANSIASSNHTINDLTEELQENLFNPAKFRPQQVNKDLETILKRTDNIQNQLVKIKKDQQATRDFVNFGYLQKVNKLELTNINSFIAETVNNFVNEKDYQYEVVVEQIYDPKLKKARIDRISLSTVIKNLLNNAFFAVAPTKEDNTGFIPTVKVQSKLIGRTLQIIIQDNGNGIPPAYQKRIFEPFVTFKRQSVGRGLGLYYVSQIATTFKGSIKVKSEHDQGSIFTFSIPLIP